MNVPLNQITQSIKIECKTANSINIPYFYTVLKDKSGKTQNNEKGIKINTIKKEIKK